MMKKHFKKLVNLALTAVMVMGMSTTTFAKESNNISNDTVTKTNNIIYSPDEYSDRNKHPFRKF